MTEAAEVQVGGRASGRLRTSRYAKVVPYLRGNLLEIGCGTSPLLHDFRSTFTSYTGCDLDADLIARLSTRYPEGTYHVVDLDHQDLPSDWVAFDTILATAVIEHLFNLEMVMSRLAERLAVGGRILLTTPTPFGNDIVLPITARVGLTSADAFADHINILNKRRMNLLAAEVGLEVIKYSTFQLGMNSFAVMAQRS